MKRTFILFILFHLFAFLFGGCNRERITYVQNLKPQSDSAFELNDLEVFKYKKIIFEESYPIPSYFEGFTTDTTPAALSKKIIMLDNENNLRLHTYKLMPSDYQRYHDEFLTVGNHKLSLDSLLQREFQLYLYFTDVYKFNWNNNDFILLKSQNREMLRNGVLYFYLLIQMQNNQFINVTLFPNGYYDVNVFGDYNRDGILDYLDWETRSDTIRLYSLENNQFVKDEQHYIVVRPSDEQKEYDDTYGNNLDYYSDVVDVKWFYPLKNE